MAKIVGRGRCVICHKCVDLVIQEYDADDDCMVYIAYCHGQETSSRAYRQESAPRAWFLDEAAQKAQTAEHRLVDAQIRSTLPPIPPQRF